MVTTPKSAGDIAADMVAALRVSDPELDTTIGSVTRKIIDAVSEQVAPAYATTYLADWIFSINTKEGASLDDFCAIFSIFRIPAKRASGTVTFTRPSIATASLPIPANTYVMSSTAPRVAFTTVASAWLLKGSKEVSVPVQAVNAGSAGNLPAGTVTLLATNVSGVSSRVVQAIEMSGGADAESDEALRERFRRTVFRSLAGTEDMFLGLALEDPTPDDDADNTARHAVVVGATKRWVEQVQYNGTAALSTIPQASMKYAYAGSSVFGADIDSGSILTEKVHYNFQVGTYPPRVVGIGTNLMADAIYDLDYEYVSSASRNDPANGISNRVDLWVAGVEPASAIETTYYRTEPFSVDTASPMFFGNFVRLSGGARVPPVQTNRFLQLAWGPIVEFPESLVIGGTTYVRDVDYWVVHDDTAFGYSPHSKFGLEWNAANQPALDSRIALVGSRSYFYNRLPRDVEERVRKWRLVTTDLQVHAAKQVHLIFNLAIMYSPSYQKGTVQAGIDRALAAWVEGLGFRSVVQVSDVLQVVHNVTGVDNVRFLKSNEPAVTGEANTWGIQKVTPNGSHISHFTSGETPARPTDIVLSDNEVPALLDVRYVAKAQNTWGGQ